MKYLTLALTLAVAACVIGGLASTGPLVTEWITQYRAQP
jgi:hypothetical protein